MAFPIKSIVAFLIILITFFSVNQWNQIPFGNTYTNWAISLLLVGTILFYRKKYFKPFNQADYKVVNIYLIWLIIGVLRGVFIAENYWEWKQLVVGTLSLSVPIFVIIFYKPINLHQTLKMWIKYALPAFFLFFFWVIDPTSYHFYLGPVLLLSCFLPSLKKNWQFVFLVLIGLMILIDFDSRSQVIKALMTLGISCLFLFSKFLGDKILKQIHFFFYALPIGLLFLGITGQFNPFEALTSYQGNYKQTKIKNGRLVDVDLAADTRTFIYVEVVKSAIKNQYILFGRTPARGNDSKSFGTHNAKELGTGKYERHANEVCFPNVFTWLGLIGMVLYALIYIKSSFLAVYRSNNFYMKIIGVFIAFRFAYGWVEDTTGFNIMNISLWMMIAMGFSHDFRNMNNEEFKTWIRVIFSNNYKLNYTQKN